MRCGEERARTCENTTLLTKRVAAAAPGRSVLNHPFNDGTYLGERNLFFFFTIYTHSYRWYSSNRLNIFQYRHQLSVFWAEGFYQEKEEERNGYVTLVRAPNKKGNVSHIPTVPFDCVVPCAGIKIPKLACIHV